MLAGPAGTDGARVVGMLTVVREVIDRPPQEADEEPGLCWACSALEGPRSAAARPRRQPRGGLRGARPSLAELVGIRVASGLDLARVWNHTVAERRQGPPV